MLCGVGPWAVEVHSWSPLPGCFARPRRGFRPGPVFRLQQSVLFEAERAVFRQDDVVENFNFQKLAGFLQSLGDFLVLIRRFKAAARVIVGHDDGGRRRLQSHSEDDARVNRCAVQSTSRNPYPSNRLMTAVQANHVVFCLT